jgi:internalin A
MPATREKALSREAARRIEETMRLRPTDLNLSNLDLTAIPDSTVRLAQLQSLDLSVNQITTIPDFLAQLAQLRALYITHNGITAIPDSLAKLTQLQSLSLHDNQITAIPDSLAQLAQLQSLFLFNNQITAIPDSLAQLTQLQGLSLHGNQITAIPDSLAQLTQLQSLDLSGNQITAIPDSLARLTQLQSLDLSGNQITTIPDSLAQLTQLQSLDLSGNQITTIPDSLAALENLSYLFLHGNPNLDIPPEVLGPNRNEVFDQNKRPKPPKEILAYYFAQRSGAKPLYEAKLILVGRGGVGKTSLVKTLTTGKFNKREKTTQGIKISDWPCPLNPTEKVTLHIWDFGGQEMMHATHQFFLTARTLYLLVLERRRGGCDEEADYWFRLIRTFGGMDAPVVIVLNKQQQAPFDVNRGAWLEKYARNIKAFVETDCTDPKSIARLREKIQEQLNGLESLKARFPTQWFAIKEKLAHMPADFVSFADYRALCRTNGEEDPEKQDSLSGFLHDLGIALNYGNDPRLRFAYVLKPEWVTKGIYTLLHAFVPAKGIFTPAEAAQVLGRQGYSRDAVEFLLGLMERFELSFPLPGPRQQILIPQILDDQQPPAASDFQPKECLNFGYRYAIVPEGLLPRFIVRTHHLSDPSARWKSGVILHHPTGGCHALVRADAPDKQVRIHINGPTDARRDLLAIIRYNFDVIHSDYGCQPKDLVYAPGVPDEPIPLAKLDALRGAGENAYPVVLPDDEVIKPAIADLMQAVDTQRPQMKLFLSYSHLDEKFIQELRKELKLMERNGLIHPWSDHALTVGELWEARILQELNEADIIVCQLSRDFLASDFCVLKELETAMQRKQRGEAELFAYVLKDCGWKEVPNLKKFQILREPLPDRNRDKYWRSVAEELQRTITKLRESPRADRPTFPRAPR